MMPKKDAVDYIQNCSFSHNYHLFGKELEKIQVATELSYRLYGAERW